MSERNRHGLSRAMPSEVQRAVRQKCGFGCVVCGCAIYQYEHLDPTFADATVHDPNGIVLLCAACHDRKTRGQLSQTSVAAAARSPKCLQTGFSFGPFDLGNTHPVVRFGPLVVRDCKVLIRAFGVSLLSVDPPESQGQPFLLSALFADRSGKEVCRIVRNEWQTPSANWDVEVVGQRITVRSAPRSIELRLRCDPPDGLTVERMAMYSAGAWLTCDEANGFVATLPIGTSLQASAAFVTGAEVALELTSQAILLGVGGGSVRLGSAQIRL